VWKGRRFGSRLLSDKKQGQPCSRSFEEGASIVLKKMPKGQPAAPKAGKPF
jgi:hypothetical protein